MKINVTDLPTFSQPVVGNVYSISGGYGRKAGHAMVLLAITKRESALMLIIDKEGDPIGVTSYGVHAIEERAPIAFVRGLDDMVFEMEALS
jgi:predicted aconitase with swiveling domain